MRSELELEVEATRNLNYGRSFAITQAEGYPAILRFDDGLPGAARELLLAEVERIKAVRASVLYRALRSAEYPSVGDQLDDLFKRGAFSATMSARIQAVKDKYPKPSAI